MGKYYVLNGQVLRINWQSITIILFKGILSLLKGLCFGTISPSIVDAGADVVNTFAFGKFGGEREKETDEAFLYYIFLREAWLLLAHLHHNLGEFRG